MMKKLRQTNKFRKGAPAGVHCVPPRLSKKLLLPVDRIFATKLCLTHHLSLVACRGDAGNDFFMSQLVRSLYMTYFLWRDGFGKAMPKLFEDAEGALESNRSKGRNSGVWRMGSECVEIIGKVLLIHDDQLAAAPLHRVLQAEANVYGFLRSSDACDLIRLNHSNVQSAGVSA